MTKKQNVSINNAAGFSLVELMVVVAIIGILASVAVPQFQKFTFKARLTEAKAGLTSLYTTEKAFYGEWSQYDTNFSTIGYAPEGNYSFNIGFGAQVNSGNWLAAGNPAPAAGNATDVNTFCNLAANAGRCRTMATVDPALASPPAAQLALNAGVFMAACSAANPAGAPSQFKGCATAFASINPENVAVTLAINEGKDLRSSVP